MIHAEGEVAEERELQPGLQNSPDDRFALRVCWRGAFRPLLSKACKSGRWLLGLDRLL